MSELENAVRFCWGEMATVEAAVSSLANDLRSSFLELTKGEREAMARMMIKTRSGRVEGSSRTVSWCHAETSVYGRSGDVLYVID